MGDDANLSVTIAHIVQRLKGTYLHSQIERHAKVSGFASPYNLWLACG